MTTMKDNTAVEVIRLKYNIISETPNELREKILTDIEEAEQRAVEYNPDYHWNYLHGALQAICKHLK